MKDSKRLFLALVLPGQIKQQIDHWRERNLYTLEQTPIPQDNYHVTLVYIGNVAEQQLSALITQFNTISADRFKLTINKTDYWPRPKVLHLIPTAIPPKLIDLQRKVDRAIVNVGLTTEKRTYQPHLSLYRKIKPQQFEQLQRDGLPEPNISIDIEHFAIFRSISEPDGVRYQKIAVFDLI